MTIFKEIKKTYNIAKELRSLNSNDDIQKKKAANALAVLFEHERGPFFKLAQYLGTSPNAISAVKDLSYREEDQIDLDWVKSFLSSLYNIPIDKIFKSIAVKAKVASIGQVHQAQLVTGEQVALKIRLPEVEDEIESQLKLLGFSKLGQLSSIARKWQVDFSDYANKFKQGILEEIDYQHELKNHLQFKSLEKYHTKVKIPLVYDNLCTAYTIVSEWVDGDNLEVVLDQWKVEQKKALAQVVLESYFLSLFKVGIIQCDFNHGNFYFNRDNGDVQLTCLDFGNCLLIDETKRNALLKLILASMNKTKIDPLAYLVALGFDQSKLMHIHAALPILLNEIFMPFTNSYATDLSQWKLSENVDKILGEARWWFRSAGPTDFFRVIQSYIGMINLLRKLDINLNWKRLFKHQLESEIASNNNFSLADISSQKYDFDAVAKNLNFIVQRDGEEKVNLTLPIAVLIDLEEYMEAEVLLKLKQKNIIIADLIKQSVASGCLPGNLFNLEDDNKTIIISLK